MSALAYEDKILSYEDKAVICASSRAIKVRTYPFVTRARPPLSYLPLVGGVLQDDADIKNLFTVTGPSYSLPIMNSVHVPYRTVQYHSQV